MYNKSVHNLNLRVSAASELTSPSERSIFLYNNFYMPEGMIIHNDSGDLRGVAGGDGELGCLCGKAGTSHLCDGSAHSSGCVVNGSNTMAAF